MTPAIRPNCRSSGVATEEAMISGLAPGKLRCHGNRREIDLRQRRYRQQPKSDGSGQRDADRQQRRGHGPANEWSGNDS